MDRRRSATAIALILLVDLVLVTAWYFSTSGGGGIEELGAVLFGFGLVVLLGWTFAICVGLRRGRRWATWAALATFSLISVGAIGATVDTSGRLRSDVRPYGAPPRHLVAPAAVAAGSLAIALLIATALGPGARRPPGVDE